MKCYHNFDKLFLVIYTSSLWNHIYGIIATEKNNSAQIFIHFLDQIQCV